MIKFMKQIKFIFYKSEFYLLAEIQLEVYLKNTSQL